MRLSVPTLAGISVTLLLAACGSSSGSHSSAAAAAAASPTPTGPTVRTAASSTLGATVLVDARGLTLYRLSGEHSGHWICVHGCLQLWHPLTITAGARPSGSLSGLGVVTHPGVGGQVTYHGMPLYTFAQDQSAGQAKGQGFKDVGTWNAVPASGHAPAGKSSQPPASSPSSGGSYGY